MYVRFYYYTQVVLIVAAQRSVRHVGTQTISVVDASSGVSITAATSGRGAVGAMVQSHGMARSAYRLARARSCIIGPL